MLNVSSTLNDIDIVVDTSCDDCGLICPTDLLTEAIDERGNTVSVCKLCIDEFYTKCPDCGEYCYNDSIHMTASGICVCEHCLDDHYMYCEDCEQYFNTELGTIQYYDELGKAICNQCFNRDYYICDRCGNAVLNTDVYDVNTPHEQAGWCRSCVVDHSYLCCNCGSLCNEQATFRHNDVWYCESCYEDLDINDDDEVIKPYHHHKGKLNDIYYTETDNRTEALTFGMELELDVGGLDHDNAFELLKCFRNSEVVAEKDGSLDNGFELITYPFSRDYYYQSLKSDLSDACSKAIDMGYRSHDTTTCGLHIHVGRAGLGATAEESEKTIAKLWLLMYRFQKQLVVFSRRSKEALTRYADMPIPSDLGVASLSEIDTPEKLYVKAKDNLGRRGRYVALNLTNEKTIEVRIFKGTLNIDTITASLQLVHNLVYLSKILSALDCQSMTWEDLRRLLILDVPELEAYLTKKAL